MFKSFTRAVGVVAVSAVFLAGCGGGGGGGGGGSSGSSAPTNVQGFAATGAAISGGTVSLKCVSGAVLTTTTAADGSFTLSPSSAQLPCMLKVTKNTTTLYSFVDGFGRLNATQLTDLLVSRAGADAADILYTNFNSTIAATIRSNLVAAKAYIVAEIRRLDLNPVNIDPLTGTFVVGDAHDQILDQLQTAMATNGIPRTLADLRTVAKNNAIFTGIITPGSVTISEVASAYFYSDSYWFEVANYGSAPVNLSGFTVKTAQSVLNVSPYTLSGSTSFSLPNVVIAPGAFLVVRGQPVDALPSSSQVVYISNTVAGGAQVPYWETGGSIELLKDGVTRAFVRFGANANQPTTNPSVYTYTAPALPNTSTSYGNSIVRFGANTTAMNSGINGPWSSVAWTTPAGPNDVPAGAADADGDGIPDSAEVPGGKFAGLDLYAMGVQTGVRDILIEVDYMASSDPGVIPQKKALDNVKAAFAAKSVNMIIDAGGLFSQAANTGYNWGGGQSVPSVSCVYLGPQTGCAGDLYKYKAQYFDVRRSAIFHYALFGTTLEPSGADGAAGLAELSGNDLLVTLGGWGLNTNTTPNTNRLINYQAGTFMHELGHNLGLEHGGNEAVNHKPNYFSVMNYLYALDGLSSNAAGIGPYQRWVCEFYPSSCVLAESASTSDSMVIDFSNGSSTALNEALLSEAANIGRGTVGGAYADWNRSGSSTVGNVSVDINGSGSLSTLNDHNDWSNIVWPFARTINGSFGARLVSSSAPSRAFDAMSDDRQPLIVETLRARVR